VSFQPQEHFYNSNFLFGYNRAVARISVRAIVLPSHPCLRRRKAAPLIQLRGLGSTVSSPAGLAGHRLSTRPDVFGGRYTQNDSAGGRTGTVRMPIGVY